ncbi:MAG TPA: TlpA disulfide reductase family protein [Solirubrobacterales bacterium]|nr:TlpA disulfide reductase family protein [Solirubrobacterales bacterium]
MEDGDRREDGSGQGPRRATIYSLIVGIAFIALIAVAGINTISTEDKGVLGSSNEGDAPLAQFAVPDARGDVSGDANIAQDDCDSARIPCPEDNRRTPACEVNVPGAIRVCDLFDRPLVLSFWFTRGGDCEDQEDVFERAYRRYSPRVNFLAIDVRDSESEVHDLIAERHWTHPIGLDRDGALSNLYRVGGCPTFVYAYPGGILQATSIGQLSDREFFGRVDRLVAASRQRAETLR